MNHFVQEVLNMIGNKGVSGGWAGWTIAHPVFGKIEVAIIFLTFHTAVIR